MMKWVWIILGFAIVIGPIMWVMPSAAQTRQSKLRARAIALGLDVKIAEMPQVHRAKVRKEDTVRGAVYRYRHPTKHIAQSWLICRESGDVWEEEGLKRLPAAQRTYLEQSEAQLPKSIYGIEQTNYGVGIYWVERGDDEVLERCLAFLKKMSDLSYAA